jgi:uncharacterized protein (TIGR03435 family)
MNLQRALLLVIAGSAPILSPLAQTPAAATSTPAITFDVVSIRPVHTDTRQFGPVFPANGDGMVLEYAPVGWVIRLAYGIDRDNRILGLPDWAKESNWENRYDIRAKVAEADVRTWKAMSDAQRWQVVRQLLADRFQLRLHKETVERPIYALVPSKGDVKIKPIPSAPGSGRGGIESYAPGVTKYHHITMDMLAKDLSNVVGRDVFDRSGLTGNYDFTLSYAKAKASTADSAALDPDFPDIFTAVQEQLGLKLEPTTGPVDVLVIDHIDRPTEN